MIREKRTGCYYSFTRLGWELPNCGGHIFRSKAIAIKHVIRRTHGRTLNTPAIIDYRFRGESVSNIELVEVSIHALNVEAFSSIHASHMMLEKAKAVLVEARASRKKEIIKEKERRESIKQAKLSLLPPKKVTIII